MEKEIEYGKNDGICAVCEGEATFEKICSTCEQLEEGCSCSKEEE